MTVNLIVAHSLNGVIGREGQIPWHLPSDMAFFRKKTEGHIVIMGRKTFESIGRPLPNRRNIVLSRNPDFHAKGVECFSSLSQIETELNDSRKPEDHVFVIGGEGIYSLFLDKATTIYLTVVDAVVNGDAFFPRLSGEWRVTLLEEHRQKPDRPLKGEWFSHRMYRLDAHHYEKS